MKKLKKGMEFAFLLSTMKSISEARQELDSKLESEVIESHVGIELCIGAKIAEKRELDSRKSENVGGEREK
ncbi:hypothetical protein RIF29_15794 [Crotalaria pallida]|uniref:Uncharacterized protein n=1 Tax=Crotalaria pallida TaxID=3830 RepID=A0AAN9FE86_CROPI